MNQLSIKNSAIAAIGSALLTLSIGAHAAVDGTTDTTRDQRMDSALQNYRDAHRSDSNRADNSRHGNAHRNDRPGRFARAENSVKRGARRTGETVKNGAEKVGSAVSNAGRKTAGALRSTGDKIHDKIGD